MFDKDRRRIIRLTSNPLSVTSKLELLAAFFGISAEELSARLLESGVDCLWEVMSSEDHTFAVDCLCCRETERAQSS